MDPNDDKMYDDKLHYFNKNKKVYLVGLKFFDYYQDIVNVKKPLKKFPVTLCLLSYYPFI